MTLICLLRLHNCLSLVTKRGFARWSTSSSEAGSDCVRSCWRRSATCARAKMQQRRGQPFLKDRYLKWLLWSDRFKPMQVPCFCAGYHSA